jgi:DNA-directed RNA polymerase II subunit RPB2
MDETITWKIIDTYFKDNPDFIAKHHLTSYNNFMLHDIPQIFKDNNPIRLVQEQNDISINCDIYIGGKNGDKVYYGKPTIYDKDRMHYMYPNEARLRNLMYAITIHYDVHVDIMFENKNKIIEKKEEVYLESVYLGRFPVMLKSKLCILNELSPEVCFNMGE